MLRGSYGFAYVQEERILALFMLMLELAVVWEGGTFDRQLTGKPVQVDLARSGLSLAGTTPSSGLFRHVNQRVTPLEG